MHRNTNMLQPLYENGLLDMDGVNRDRIERLSFSKILDIYDEISSLVAGLPKKENIVGRVFCASNSLSGAPYECSERSCRISRVDELSKFSSLFADNVLFHNFLADLSPSFGHAPSEDGENFRYRVVSDIYSIYKLKDLMYAGIVQPYTAPNGYCLDCFSNKFLGKSSSGIVSRARARFKRDLENSMEVYISYDHDGYYVVCEADEMIFPHGSICISLNSNDLGNLSDDFLIKAKENKIYLTNKQRRELGFGESISYNLVMEAVYQKSISRFVGGSILTHSSSEINALKSIEGDQSIKKTNDILSKHWNIIIPYAEQLSASELLTLREREPEAFVTFRNALDTSVGEAFSLKNSFTEQDARELYSGIIQPSLAKMEISTKSARKDLIKKPFTVLAGVGAVLGVGAYSGLLSGDLATAAQALGLGKVLYDGVTSTIEMSDVTKTIKQEDYYYLWKMNRMKGV